MHSYEVIVAGAVLVVIVGVVVEACVLKAEIVKLYRRIRARFTGSVPK